MTRWAAVLRRIENIPAPVGAEIGVHQGQMSAGLLAGNSRLKLFCVDPWSADSYDGKGDEAAGEKSRRLYTFEADNNYRIACDAVEKYNNRVLLIRETSLQAINHFQDNSFDFVFIDARHDYESALEDIKAWLPKVKKPGYICGHDYGCWEGVTRAVNEIFGKPDELDADFTWFVRV